MSSADYGMPFARCRLRIITEPGARLVAPVGLGYNSSIDVERAGIVMRTAGWMLLAGLLLGRVGLATPVIQLVTEDAPPLAMVSDGKLGGPAPPFVEKVFERAKVPFTHQVYPWARSYAMATTMPNVVIYSLARTMERESRFKWIGQLLSTPIALYSLARRQDIRLDNLEQAKKLNIGVVLRDVRLDWLRQQGFADRPPGGQGGLDLSDGSDSNYRKLQRGMVDVIPVSPLAMQAFCREKGIDCRLFRRVYTLPLTTDLYLAASLDTPDETVTALRHAFTQLVRDGTYRQAFAGLPQ